MSAEKHTPGPWLIQGNTVYALMHHVWRKGVELFKNRFSVQLSFDSSCSKEEIEATKQLIAAAPDLLDALIKYMNAIDMFDLASKDGINYHGAIGNRLAAEEIAREAIAKATGGAA